MARELRPSDRVNLSETNILLVDDNPQALPTRIIADRTGEFELRLRIEAWSAAGRAD